jgi:hypothetical protein
MDETIKELLEAIEEYHSVEDCQVEGRFDCRLCASIKAVEQMRAADTCPHCGKVRKPLDISAEDYFCQGYGMCR